MFIDGTDVGEEMAWLRQMVERLSATVERLSATLAPTTLAPTTLAPTMTPTTPAPTTPAPTGSPTTSPSASPWRLGGAGQSCDQVCTAEQLECDGDVMLQFQLARRNLTEALQVNVNVQSYCGAMPCECDVLPPSVTTVP